MGFEILGVCGFGFKAWGFRVWCLKLSVFGPLRL